MKLNEYWACLILLVITVVAMVMLPQMHVQVVSLLALVCMIQWLRQARLLHQVALREQRWKFALEGARHGVWDWHVPTDSVEYSDYYKQMHGFTDEDIHSDIQQFKQRIHPDDQMAVANDIAECLEQKVPFYENEHRIRCKDGSVKWVLARGKVIEWRKGQPVRMVGTHTDITGRKQMEKQIRELAHYDALTGLPNRSLFHDRVHQAFKQARRSNSGVAVIFIDLDEFKPVNDQYGHDVGDRLLQQAASRLLSTVRTSDTIARLGGDEFVALLSNVEEVSAAEVVAEKILHTMLQPYQIDGHQLTCGASIGVAMYPEHADDEKLLLINADIAMYHVKKQGGHNFCFYRHDMQSPHHVSQSE